MVNIKLIEKHTLIRETIGYKALSEIPLKDVPQVLSFLRIIQNYIKMKNIIKNENIS